MFRCPCISASACKGCFSTATFTCIDHFLTLTFLRSVCRDAHASSIQRFLSLIRLPLPSWPFFLLHTQRSVVSASNSVVVIVYVSCLFCERHHTHSLRCVSSPHTFLSVRNVFVEKHYFATIQQKLLLQRCPGRRPLSFVRASLWTELSALCFSLASPPLQRTCPPLSLPHVKDAEQDACASFSVFLMFFLGVLKLDRKQKKQVL